MGTNLMANFIQEYVPDNVQSGSLEKTKSEVLLGSGYLDEQEQKGEEEKGKKVPAR